MNPTVVELLQAEKTFPGPPPVRALNPTTLRIRAGDSLAVVGPSGSGKSTLLSLLAMLDTPTSGEVIIDGFRTEKLRRRQQAALRASRLGFVFQQFHLLPRLSAAENVATGLLYSHVRAKERKRRSIKALEDVGLADRIHHRPGQMSGGQQQRVAIARALVRNPTILYADEPTGALDSQTGKAILDLLLRTADRGTAVVVVTHDLDIASHFSRRLRVLDGTVTEEECSERRPNAATT